ncbi:unnamed protein product [Arabidopsis lyrata]|nr:unnamed protein product [Arabidopsis lyrata]
MKPFLEQHGGAIGETITNLIPGAANNLQHKFFMVYCVLGFLWMERTETYLNLITLGFIYDYGNAFRNSNADHMAHKRILPVD